MKEFKINRKVELIIALTFLICSLLSTANSKAPISNEHLKNVKSEIILNHSKN